MGEEEWQEAKAESGMTEMYSRVFEEITRKMLRKIIVRRRSVLMHVEIRRLAKEVEVVEPEGAEVEIEEGEVEHGVEEKKVEGPSLELLSLALPEQARPLCRVWERKSLSSRSLC